MNKRSKRIPTSRWSSTDSARRMPWPHLNFNVVLFRKALNSLLTLHLSVCKILWMECLGRERAFESTSGEHQLLWNRAAVSSSSTYFTVYSLCYHPPYFSSFMIFSWIGQSGRNWWQLMKEKLSILLYVFIVVMWLLCGACRCTRRNKIFPSHRTFFTELNKWL
jgi:hypothetical protein